MKRGTLGLCVIAAMVLGVFGAVERRASGGPQSPPNPSDAVHNLHLPAAYVATLNGRLGWDVTPDLVISLFMDADRTFDDLVPVIDPGPKEADHVVHPDAWATHVVVLRMNLGLDERATQLNLHEYLARFQHVLQDEMNLRNRRVVLWVQRADDLPALLIPTVPEVIRVGDAQPTLSQEFVDRFKAEGGPAPEAPDLSQVPSCTTSAELLSALGLPEDAKILAGDSLKIVQRWIDFRDNTLEMAQKAVGEQWDEYERIINDPDAQAYQKINARRDIASALRTAHLHVIRYDDLSKHPVFAPLCDELLKKITELSQTPVPKVR